MTDTEKITVRLPKKFLKELDFLVDVDDFPSRSEAIRSAVRDMLYYRVELAAEKAEKMAKVERAMNQAKAVRDEYLKP